MITITKMMKMKIVMILNDTQGCLPRLAKLLNKLSTKALTALILLVLLQVGSVLYDVILVKLIIFMKMTM